MRRLLAPLTLAGAIACASAGAAPLGDPTDDLRTAQQMIAAAEQAGADSVGSAAAQLDAARAALAEANASTSRDQNWASLKARDAASKAAYARALAEKARSEKARDEARTAVDQVPPGGAR